MRSGHFCFACQIASPVFILYFFAISFLARIIPCRFSRYCVPVMTTIVQPSEQIALQSIELLIRQIEHGASARTVTLQPELQQGESVCPCRRRFESV